jgi:cbb3-type cytochrome oxidase subunit 1
MSWFIKAFIRASLIWFTLGVILGLVMALVPAWSVYRPAHAHLVVAGFLSMLVFGVGYQLLPRLFGAPLWSTRLAALHLYASNAGLALLVAGFLVRPHEMTTGAMLLAAGGLTFAAGALAWSWNLWRTFDAADARDRAGLRPGRSNLPTLGQ